MVVSFSNFFSRGIDPTNKEIGRALWAVSVLAGIGYSGAHLIINGVFDIMQFGTGIGSILLLGGAGIGAKDLANKSAAPTGDSA